MEEETMIGPYCVDSVTLRKHNGSDVWQTPITATDETVKAFIDYGEHRIQNASGEVIVSMAKVLMASRTIITSGYSTRTANTISYKDTIIFDGETHAIMRISKARDFSVRAMEVYVA